MRPRKVLISAYACEPGKGSEPGVGWLWALAAAKTSEVWVLTRANNRAAIEADAASSSASLRFVYVDLPPWVTRWKRPGRNIRLYYLAWQLAAMQSAKRLHAAESFDVVHHVTFANLWLPSLTSAVDAPFVLGPVAGGQRVARAHYGELGALGIAKEASLLGARRIAGLSPLVRTSWRRAGVILLNNNDTLHALPGSYRSKAFLRPGQCVAGLEPAPPTAAGAPPTALYAGRLHRFKAVHLAIRALALAREWQLVVVGNGPERERLRSLARSLGILERVVFRPAVPQTELWRLMAKADAFVLPSLKEGGGFAAAEAAALGLPVVAFDRGGPAALAEFYPEARIELVSPESSYVGIAAALERLGKRTSAGPALEVDLASVADDLEWIYGYVERGRGAPLFAVPDPVPAERVSS
jgi:glycosyltransferase involved in cell wall biosynthesis